MRTNQTERPPCGGLSEIQLGGLDSRLKFCHRVSAIIGNSNKMQSCVLGLGCFDVQHSTKPMPILQVQGKANEQTIEHDLRRSYIVTLECLLFNKLPLALNKRIAFDDAPLCFKQFHHA